MDNYPYVFGFIQGVLTFVSPCILPLLPVYFSYLAGIGADNKVQGKSYGAKLVINSLAFIAGFTLIFVLLGAAATSLGHFLRSGIDIFRRISGIIMIVFGLNFLGILKFNFLNIEKRLEYRFKELKFFSSIIFGMVFGFGWSPCSGPFLGSALIMAANSNTVGQGILLLFVYSMGLGVPFILTAALMDKMKYSIESLQKHNRVIRAIAGFILIVGGILVFTDGMKYIGGALW